MTALDHGAVLAHAAGQDLRTAHVDADGVQHAARVRGPGRARRDGVASCVDVGQAVPRVSRRRADRAPRRRAGAAPARRQPSPEDDGRGSRRPERRRGPVILPAARGPAARAAAARAAVAGSPARAGTAPPPPRPHPHGGRASASRCFCSCCCGWVVLGYLAFRSSVEEANARLDAHQAAGAPALTPAGRPAAEHARPTSWCWAPRPDRRALGHAADHPHRPRQAPGLDPQHPARSAR